MHMHAHYCHVACMVSLKLVECHYTNILTLLLFPLQAPTPPTSHLSPSDISGHLSLSLSSPPNGQGSLSLMAGTTSHLGLPPSSPLSGQGSSSQAAVMAGSTSHLDLPLSSSVCGQGSSSQVALSANATSLASTSSTMAQVNL